MNTLMTLLLFTGILPSLTSLSLFIQNNAPQIYRWTGPLNFLKIMTPFMIIFIIFNLNKFPLSLRKIYAWILAIGTLSVFVSGAFCYFPPSLMRDWAVFCTGILAAISFFLLPLPNQKIVLKGWVFILFFFIITDSFFPILNQWFYENIFDANTKKMDFAELGAWALTGVWSRQSLAKIMTYIPWIFFAFSLIWIQKLPNKRQLWSILFALVTLLVLFIITLSTSQRGPFLAQFLSLALFTAILIYRIKNIKILYASIGVLITCLALVFIFVPENLWKPRLLAPFRSKINIESTPYGSEERTQALLHNAPIDAIHYRERMLHLSLNIISKNPLGHACLSEVTFLNVGFQSPGHSHNMFLQHFLDRGWLWGFFHLALWICALIGALRKNTYFHLAIGCGIFSAIISGFFDYPWFVIHHSVLLHILLLYGLDAYYNNEKKKV